MTNFKSILIFLFKYNIKNMLLPLNQQTVNIFGHTERFYKKDLFHRNIEIVLCRVKSA
jgi:hypothetical protein